MKLRKLGRFLLALAAALLAGTLTFPLLLTLATFPSMPSPPKLLHEVAGFLKFSFPITAVHIFFLGLPAYFLLRKFKLVTWWGMALTGFLAGSLPVLILLVIYTQTPLASRDDILGISGISLTFGISGLFAALSAWLILREKSH